MGDSNWVGEFTAVVRDAASADTAIRELRLMHDTLLTGKEKKARVKAVKALRKLRNLLGKRYCKVTIKLKGEGK